MHLGGAPAIGEPAVEPPGFTQSVSLYVGKTFRTSNTAAPVGTSTKPILNANIVAGCQAYFKKNWTNQVCSTPGVATNGTGSASSPARTVSAADDHEADDRHDEVHGARPGPANPCNGASRLGCSSSTTTRRRNTSLQIPAASGSISLFHLKNTNQADTGNNFDCRFYDGTGTLVGQLTWVDGNPGTLTVNGTIYIDGNLNLSANDNAVYNGHRDASTSTGRVHICNGARLCAATLR